MIRRVALALALMVGMTASGCAARMWVDDRGPVYVRPAGQAYGHYKVKGHDWKVKRGNGHHHGRKNRGHG